MANNCLVTKLKAVVDNDNLVPLGYMRITLAYPKRDFVLYPERATEPFGKQVSGPTLYKTSAFSEAWPTTMQAAGDYLETQMWKQQDDQQFNEINFNKNNIWAIGGKLNCIVENSSGYRWWHVDFKDLCYSNISLYFLNNYYLNEGETAKIEDLFISIFRRAKEAGSREFENIENLAWYPCVINLATGISTQQNMTFHDVPFEDKRLFMSTEIDNNILHIYDTVSDYSISTGYHISHEVARCNVATGEWTYYDE